MTQELLQHTERSSPSGSQITSAFLLRGKALLVVSFVVVVGFIAAVYTICGGPVYETNDDVGLSMISAGIGFADRPDDHLHFSHYLVGRFLNTLYGINQAVPWYGLNLLLVQVVSLTIIARVLLARGKRAAGLFAVMAFLFCACTRSVFFMQFTTTAALLASAGGLLLLVAAERGKSLALRQLIPVLILVTAGAMIRCESAKLILLLTSFALAARFLPRLEWSKLIISALSVLVTLAAVFAVEFSNKSYYARDQWKEFHSVYSAYFPLIHKHINPSDPASVRAFESVGWSPADLGMFKRWYMLDDTKYSVEKINKVNDSLPAIAPGVTFEYVASAVLAIITDLTIAPMLVAGVGLLFCLRRYRFPFVSGLLFLAASSALCLYLLIDLHLPARVYSSILSFSILVLLIYASPVVTQVFSDIRVSENSGRLRSVQLWLWRSLDWDKEDRIASWQRFALGSIPFILVINLLVVPFVSTYQGLSAKTKRASEALKASIKKLAPSPKDLYVVWGTSFPFENVKPFDNLNDYFAHWKLVWMGAYARSPLVVSRLEQFGIHDPVLECDHPNLFHISCSLFNGGIKSYLSQVCGKRLHEKALHELAPGMYVYKLSKTEPASWAESDVSPLCPKFGKDDQVLFPGREFELRDLEFVGENSGSTSYKLTGSEARMVFREPIEVDPEVFPTLCIEAKIDPWIIDYRDIGIQIIDPVNNGLRMRLASTVHDDKSHRYALDLRVKGLKSGQRIKLCDVRPVRTRNEAFGETVCIKRIALVRQPLQYTKRKKVASTPD